MGVTEWRMLTNAPYKSDLPGHRDSLHLEPKINPIYHKNSC